MIQTFWLKGKPLSTQSLYIISGKRRFKSPEAKKLKESYIKQIHKQKKTHFGSDDLYCIVDIYFPRLIGDWDNFHKLYMDAMEGIIFENDKQICMSYVNKHKSKNEPGIKVRITNDILEFEDLVYQYFEHLKYSLFQDCDYGIEKGFIIKLN